MTNCPVCGMAVDEKNAPARAMHQGKTYYFCSEQCKKQFEQQPDRYVSETQTTR